ncbi:MULTISPECIES: response regulator transcription factor [Priestia]|jgi:two-component system, OmpR family, lantibiotic biosynthesis response regulator NisR/SpaR|uniref:response regulator transcription factor n=1 Tax=Priestia TaxID=2800373 RepID=UPI00204036A3|nr:MULTISPECIES: response regulator transcription factor [Priestia]MCM3770282.1 response regulator transcription factor [Priestia aryabhattai]MDY0940654.1 response regulator transcription factor [Priestia megaterium]
MNKKILLVDDEKDIISFMKDALHDEGYEVLFAYEGKEALKKLKINPDLIVLDVMMPGMDGFELCELIRKSISCPIIFLSAKQTEQDRVKGLLVGGDDYLVKPFSMKELKARIYAHLRREQRISNNSYNRLHFGQLTIDLNGYQILHNNEVIPFTSREFEIIHFLALHPGQVFTREQLYEKVWGYDAEGDSSTITEHVKKIRAKLLKYDATPYISTVWGIGYKWVK